MNSKMIKSGMRVLIGREKVDVTVVDVAVAWKLQPVAGIVVDKRERENWYDIDKKISRLPIKPG
jgi:hypothetical protein